MRSFLGKAPTFTASAAGLVLALAAATGASAPSFAGSVAISLKNNDAPAVDLLYRDEPIDRDEAVDLRKRGVDLSLLDPVPSDAWHPEELSATEAPGQEGAFPPEGGEVRYDSAMPSSNGLYRSRVVQGQGADAVPYQLMVSLAQHASLARAALLRKLGYPVQNPRWYRRLTVRFPDIASRTSFLDNLSDATQTARTRWAVNLPDNDPVVTLQDVTLEPAQIEIPMYHWGVIPSTHLKGRRALRALIVPIVLLDVQETVNLYSWIVAYRSSDQTNPVEGGPVINNSIIFSYPYAESFSETSYDDARWVARRIARLTRQDFVEIAQAGQYPPDITALLVEKFVARRNHLVQLFNLDHDRRYPCHLPYNVHVTTGAVKDGKATQEHYDGYVLRFTWGDPESPLRAGEIARFLAIEGINTAMQGLLTEANRFLTVSSPTDVANRHQADVIAAAMQHQHDHPGTPYSVPLSAWGGPVGGFGLSASREVVTGTYYGSDAKAQLVDNIAVQANLGYFVGIDGLRYITPSFSANLVVQRNFLHVRPIPDMSAALHSNWANLYVPKFMGELGQMLDPADAGDDQNKWDSKLHTFLDALKEGEMLIVTDSVVAGVKGQVNIPIPIFMTPGLSQFNPSFGIGGGTQPTILRRTTFTRTADGIQVYIQNSFIVQANVEFDFNWWVNILRLQHIHKHGWGKTQAYLLDKEPDEPEVRRHMVLALRGLIHANDSEILAESFKDYELNHDMVTDIDSAKFLVWKWAGIEEDHRVTISPPGHPDNVRTLYSDHLVQTKGIDGYAFFSDIVSALTQGIVTIDRGSSGYYPSNSFLGSGSWVSVTTEAETTPGYTFAPVTTIEHHWGGWLLSKAGLLNTIDAIDRQVRPLNLDHPLVNKDVFESTHQLQMYEVLSTLIVYQSGMQKLGHTVFEPTHVSDAVASMVEIEGPHDLDDWCGPWWRRLGDWLFGINSYSEWENGHKFKFKCLKPWMRKLLDYRHDWVAGKAPKKPEERVKWTNHIMGSTEKNLDLPKLLRWIGKDNYFFQIRVSGFRTEDENGDTTYVSDTIGNFNDRQGSGVFHDFAQKYGIMTSELYATYLSEGF